MRARVSATDLSSLALTRHDVPMGDVLGHGLEVHLVCVFVVGLHTPACGR